MRPKSKALAIALSAAALITVALLGATAASAAICSKSGAGAGCEGGFGNAYTGALSAKLASGKSATFTSGFTIISCSQSTLGGEVASGPGGKGTITSFTFGSCTSAQVSNCSFSTSVSSESRWPLLAKVSTAPNGSLAIEGFTTIFTCTVFGLPTTCRYYAATSGSKIELSVTGGETAQLTSGAISLERESGPGGGLCSETAVMDGVTYSVTTPDSLYLSTKPEPEPEPEPEPKPISICTQGGSGELCQGGVGRRAYTGALSAKLASGKSAVFAAGFANAACTESTLGGEVTSGKEGKGSITSLTFGTCSTGEGSCTVTSSAAGGNKWPLEATFGTAPSGTLKIENVTFTLACGGGAVTCRYKAAAIGTKGEVALTGGQTAKLTMKEVPLEKEEASSGSCSATATWDATYSITTPASLYLT